MNESLTQEEIEALLEQNGTGSAPAPGLAAEVSAYLSPEEIDTLGEIGNISMGAASTSLSILLDRKVEITTPRVSLTTLAELRERFVKPFVAVQIQYREGLRGLNVLILQDNVAATIAALMMGRQVDLAVEKVQVGELELSAVGEAMNQMIGSAATAMSSMFKQRITISAPTVDLVAKAEDTLELLNKDEKEILTQISFRITFDATLVSEIIQLIPLRFAKEMVASLWQTQREEVERSLGAAPAPVKKAAGAGAVADPAPSAAGSIPASTPDRGEGVAPGARAFDVAAPRAQSTGELRGGRPVVVHPAQFAPLTATLSPEEMPNLELIMDVPLQLTVELGRARMTIKSILELGVGSVIELDRLAGEPVDILVNGKLVAHGEVVVIDENFGVKVTEIVSPLERLTVPHAVS